MLGTETLDKLKKHTYLIVFIWIGVLSLLFSLLSLTRHNNFQSGGFDLGLYDQAIWQYSRFEYPYNTIKERFILGDHLTLTLPLLAPLFWIWDDVRALLIFQAVWISFSTLAIYKLAIQRQFTMIVAVCLSFLYSLFYGIQYAVFFDFHPVVIGVGLMAWLVYFFESGKWKLFWITLILLLATQENMGIAVAGLGIIYTLRKKTRWVGVLGILGGIGVSLVAAKIIAFFSPIGFQYTPQFSLNPLVTFNRFFDSPEKREVWWYTYSWFSFVPLFSPGSTLAVFLDLGQYFVTGPEFSRMWSPFMHHRITLAVPLILGILEVFEGLRVRKFAVDRVAIVMVAVAFFFQYQQHLPINKLVKYEFWRKEPWMKNNRTLLRTLSPEDSVASQQNLVPHLSHRKEIYLVWPRLHEITPSPCGKKFCWWLDFAGKPEYLVVDARPNQWLTQILESNENYIQAIENLEKAKKIKLKTEIGDGRIYQIIYPLDTN